MKIKITLLLTLCISYFNYAQNINISGTVTDAVDGGPIPGVNIIVKDSNIGSSTDFDGIYNIENVPTNAILQFSYVGYITKEIAVNGQTSINVLLEGDVGKLEEVVIIGYGTQKKKEVTGAVATVSAETIEALKPTRIEQALQGQVAGVNVTSQSGAPGSASDIRIRGVSTNKDNRPLILVDGNVIEDLSVINPNDIASYTVLKDATAGIYGVRAANGVILITTKTGKKNKPMSFNYDAYVGFQETTRKIPLLNATEYALIKNEAAAASGNNLPFPNTYGLGKGTDWQDEVFETAPIFSNAITASGGTEKSTYSFGASLLTQDGIVGGSKANFTRYNSRINYGLEIIENLNLKANLIYTGTTRKTLPESGLGSVLFNAVNFAPTDAPTDENGAFTSSANYPIEVVNPLKQIENTFNRAKVDKISGVFGLNYKFLDGFSAEVNYQWNYAEVRERYFSPIVEYGNSSVFDNVSGISLTENLNYFRDYTFDAIVNYEKNINDSHNVKLTLGNSVFKTSGNFNSLVGENLPEGTVFASANVFDALDVTNPNLGRSTEFDSRLLSYFGRLQYNYKGKYLFSAVLRRDGSSKFGPENKFGYFPSASAGWVASDESFLENSNTINFLKFRGSYGVLGNDRIDEFKFVSTLNGEGVYVFDDQIITGSATGAIANPEVKWEEQKALDIGFETRLFNNKIDITADYFKRKTENLLLDIQTSSILGTTAPAAGPPTVNAGTVENKGLEFQISYKDNLSDNFKFNISYNFTTLKNEVLEVNNGADFVEGGSFGIGQEPPARMQVGQPIGVFYGLQTNGVFQTQAEVDAHPSQLALGANAQPGDLRYVDLNQDGKIDIEDRTFIGDPIPDVTMGLNLTFDYKNFDFQTYFFASIGNDIVRNYDRNSAKTNLTSYALDRWTGPGSTNSNPRITEAATTNFLFSDYYVEDGSFVRAQNMQLGYTFDKDKLQNIGLNNIRLYVSVSNVFTLTEYSGFDATASNGAPIGSGFDPGFYPNPRTFLFGTNVKF
ncbi:TonB-linked SusC/RagA family outer membrane protein [Lacinutrix venerupis]|uniref:SusC/RagA family TonB-linked outer membrane protein n=1 Tax=Lacinutrix venerupis TaxID=1486034 RepID=UPI000EAB74EF|nr:TonB-dependent receptor [Lacinutrix venerupis]RLJ62630.1 TonB-linked SusC/RagA family outer membrane protein [Lacinutrix venerupis]